MERINTMKRLLAITTTASLIGATALSGGLLSNTGVGVDVDTPEPGVRVNGPSVDTPSVRAGSTTYSYGSPHYHTHYGFYGYHYHDGYGYHYHDAWPDDHPIHRNNGFDSFGISADTHVEAAQKFREEGREDLEKINDLPAKKAEKLESFVEKRMRKMDDEIDRLKDQAAILEGWSQHKFQNSLADIRHSEDKLKEELNALNTIGKKDKQEFTTAQERISDAYMNYVDAIASAHAAVGIRMEAAMAMDAAFSLDDSKSKRFIRLMEKEAENMEEEHEAIKQQLYSLNGDSRENIASHLENVEDRKEALDEELAELESAAKGKDQEEFDEAKERASRVFQSYAEAVAIAGGEVSKS